MTDLIKHQLQQSIATMTKVLHDEAIHAAVVEAGRITAEAMKSGRKLLVCGNGGSAADSQHLVAEFVSRLTGDRPALRAIALTTDSSASSPPSATTIRTTTSSSARSKP